MRRTGPPLAVPIVGYLLQLFGAEWDGVRFAGAGSVCRAQEPSEVACRAGAEPGAGRGIASPDPTDRGVRFSAELD
jgi:hypothetical protein